MAETVRGVSALQNELERAKESLKYVDENIKKLTGRDPTIQRVPQRRVALGNTDRGGRTAGAEGRLFNLARRGIIQEDTSPVKRRTQPGGAFARLGPMPGRNRRGGRGRDSGDEDELPNRPSLQSSVIATSREERSRQNSIEEQSRDRKGQARNRRMFGLLLGTLQKFKDDAAVSKEKEEQRQKIEKKLDEKFKQEKEEIIKERRQLFLERRQKQFRIRLLEQKMEMAQNRRPISDGSYRSHLIKHEDWERETRKLENFIITKAKPCLFYLPKILTADTIDKLSETKEAITCMIEMRRKKMEEEIADMMNQVQDVGMEEGDEHGDVEEGMDGDSEDEHADDKENERERHLRMKKERDEHLDSKDDLEEERERRDREREQKDRDRQFRDRSGEGRKGREYRERSRDKSKEERRRDKEGDPSDGRKERERDRQRDKDHRRVRNRSDKSRSRERERHRSGKSRSDRKRDHSDEEKSRGHGNKSKRKSRAEGKAEKREKVWEPMEDEIEEEFVGSKESEKVSIASKMLEMAGMTEAVKEAQAAEETKMDFNADLNTAAIGEAINLEDIPQPSENGGSFVPGNTSGGGADGSKDQLEAV